MMDLQEVIQQTCLRTGEWLPEVDSTNSHALQNLGGWAELPALIGAGRQTRGRGRGSNSWWAGEGSLTFSLIIEPGHWNISQQHWPLLSLATGVAVCEAVEGIVPPGLVSLKWPNDVYLRGKKLAGILMETNAAFPALLVVGVGMNVNNSMAPAPADIRERAISLTDELRRPVNAQAVLVAFLQAFEARMQDLSQGTAGVIDAVRQRCFLTGRVVTIGSAGMEATGSCQGVDCDGALLLNTEAGMQRFHAGVVKLED